MPCSLARGGSSGEAMSQLAGGGDRVGWTMPWYSALPSLDELLVERTTGMMHIVCYVRDNGRVFETYWTTRRGVQVMDNSYRLMDITVWGRQEPHEDSPDGWPQPGRSRTGSTSCAATDVRSRSGPGSNPDAPTTSPARPD